MDIRLSPAEHALLSTFARARLRAQIPSLPAFAPADSWPALLQEPLERATEKLIEQGLIQTAGIEAHVDRYKTKAELKSFLAEHKLPVSGDKPELINRAITAGITDLLSPEEKDTLYAVSATGKKLLEQFYGDKKTDYLYRRIVKFLIEATAAGVIGNKADDFINYIYNLVTGQKGVEIVKTETPVEGATDGANTVRGFPPPLKSFEFITVKLDEYGRVVDRRRDRAKYFSEDLGRGVSLEMVQIPGGKFMMGSPEAENDRFDDEILHEVRISPFFISKYAVTQRQWSVVTGWPKVRSDLDHDPAKFKGADRPVETVSWEDAIEFCARLSKRTGREYRLPTEAEWEYACRAGTNTPFSFGETITPDIVNYNGEHPYAKAKKGLYRLETVPVGSLGFSNDYGLFDMHGNVWEWCQDWFSKEYFEECKQHGGVTDPQGPGTGGYRVLRGGSWLYIGGSCRSGSRFNVAPGNRFNYFGFRVVVSARTS